MSPHTNKISSKNVKRNKAQQGNSGRSILSNFFLNYLAVAKMLKTPASTCLCITLIGINAIWSDPHEGVSIITIQFYQNAF